ncbi:alpha/beta hydrolase [Amaricoccus solimangrovi]|uniref:Alpha/beta-hydrolase catalytic domain-containing protein n=1 Tax=Amaricoccus solimangrovi TaxID=2589815 RepID=A0A501X104_9RHOB|nr:alpha/beta-hydrolase family protein [Amaricoccus solimangrovi]TPE53891.1 hypothetical protein FJM51_02255 [Amaricoccus solimangrovi]
MAVAEREWAEDPAWPRISPIGLVLAAACFGASLTPSLAPRDPLLLGLLGGLAAAIGHEIGGLLQWIWRFLGLPVGPRAWRGPVRLGAAVIALAIAAFCLTRVTGWQNAVRAVTGVAPVESSYPLEVAAIGLAVFAAFWLVFRAIGEAIRRVSRLLERVLPPRVSAMLGTALALLLVWIAVERTALDQAMRAANASFAAADARIEPDIPRPSRPDRAGGPGSLVEWNEMGRWGRSFVATAPTRDEIAGFFGAGAKDSVRVYVGLGAAPTARERAEIALRELIRLGGFERSALIVTVPVGTGWMDPGGHDTVEFMLGGDVATVAVQYSYLTSVLSLIDDRSAGVEQARELFNLVYEHWRSLPRDHRPKFYVHGLSQGAYNTETTLPILDMLGDPIQGALWAGSPFFSPLWARVRDGRHRDSPVWRPRWGNGSLVRAMNQQGGLAADFTPWGPTRLVFLNYGSDPIVLFTFDSAFRPPAFLAAPRAPDVAPELRWFPVVTMLQLAVDSAISLKTPRFGHFYVAPDYIDGWAAVTDPPGWSPARAEALKALFAARPAPF